jgi:HlyD family secretion protein
LKVNTQVGEKVTTGKILAELDPKSLSQAVILAEADLVNARKNLENLLNSGVARSQAQVALAKATKDLDKAIERQNSLAYQRGSRDQIDTARANYTLAVKEVERAQEFFNGVATFGEENPNYAAALSALSSARQRRDITLGNLNYLLSKPDPKDVAEIDAQVALARSQYEDAKREWERLEKGPDPRDITAAQTRIAALEATLALTHLDAPFAGTISDVKLKSGDQAAPGSVMFRLDDLSRLLVDVQITEVDINRIRLGFAATVTFDAIQGKEYKARVIEVARYGTSIQGTVNFIVTLELIDVDEAVRPGMTAAVNIVVSELEDVLLVPNRAIRLRQGERVVYILRDNVPTPVVIGLGASSESFSAVQNGDLAEGDLVLLNPPAEARPAGGPPPFVR